MVNKYYKIERELNKYMIDDLVNLVRDYSNCEQYQEVMGELRNQYPVWSSNVIYWRSCNTTKKLRKEMDRRRLGGNLVRGS